MDNIDAELALQKITKIHNLEKKFSRVYYVPGFAFLFVVIFIFINNVFISPINNSYLAILLASNIFVTGNAAIQRSEYLRQTIALKESECIAR